MKMLKKKSFSNFTGGQINKFNNKSTRSNYLARQQLRDRPSLILSIRGRYSHVTPGWDCVVSIATHYGLDGPGIESWWGRDILHLSRMALRATQPPVQWVPGLFPWDTVAGAWRPPTPFSTEVKERVELYLSSPCQPLWPLLG